MISLDPAVVGGKRTFTIVFSSNAPTLPNFDGTEGSLANDGNQEIWIYQIDIPGAAEVDLSTGDEIFQDLSAGTFKRLTDTTPSRPLVIDSNPPDIRDDNREATISDDGNVIAFISVRDLVTGGNIDFNPELFLARTTNNWGTFAVTQATNTQDHVVGPRTFSRFQQNPSLSANGSRVAFLSTANLAGNNDDDGSGHGNAEVYVADLTASGLSNIRQITKTKDFPGLSTNLLSPGRRLSRNGLLVTFESLAEDLNANTAPTELSHAIFVYNISAGTFVKVVPRALAGGDQSFIHFPAFTDYDSSLSPSTVIFASALNFKTDGTFPAVGSESTGLNPSNQPQIFATQAVGTPNTFIRLTNNPIGGFGLIRPLTTQTRKRIVFSLAGSDFGNGNLDGSSEVFLLLTPIVTSESTAVLSFFAGASVFPVAAATPNPSPSPTPTPSPSPSPGTVATGLSPGELSIVRSTVALAPGNKNGVGASETDRSPILPVELAGVSVSVNGAAAGLYFVGTSPDQIFFVMPVSLAPSLGTVVVNNNGTVFRGYVQIVPSQPDLFTSTNGPGGNAIVCNVTNSTVPGCVTGPFNVTSPDSTGALVPTILEIYLTGVRYAAASEAKVTIGTTDITPTSVRPNTNMFGYDIITITLPASLAGSGPVPVVVTVTKSNGTFTSRSVDTAPKITIN